MKILSSLAAFAFLATLSLFPAKASAQDSVTLRIANFSSAGGGIGQTLDAYAKQLEEATGGRLKAEVFHGASMGPAQKHFDLVKSGVADMTIFVAAYTPGRFPKTELLTLPNIFSKAATGSAATELIMQVAPEALYEEFDGVKVLWIAASPQDRLYTTKAPIRTLDDVKGKRIRVGSATTKEVLKAIGADPISMPAGEIAESLQKNAIDGLHASRGTIWTFKVGEMVHYQTPILKVQAVVGLVINRDAYDKLPADLQKAVDDLGGAEKAVSFIKAYEEENPVVNEYVDKLPIEAVEPDAGLMKAVDDAAAAYNEAILAKADKDRPDLRVFYNRVREMDQAIN